MERGYLEDYGTWKNNKMEGMTWIHLAQGTDTWLSVLITVSHKTQPVSGLRRGIISNSGKTHTGNPQRMTQQAYPAL
jgi:hypothetical protein